MNDNDLNKIAKLMDSKLDKFAKVILEYITDNVMSVVADTADKEDIERIERKLNHYIDQTTVLKSRVDTIESLPTVAHELRSKR